MAKEQIGLIAGGGQFPLIAAHEARERGYLVHAIAIENETSEAINKEAQKVSWIKLGQLSRLINLLKENDIKKVILAGTVAHRHIFKQEEFDKELKALLSNLRDKSGDSILKSLSNLLEKEHIEVVDSTKLVSNWLAPKGVLSQRGPTEKELADIRYGYSIALEIAQLNIGQSIAVKDGAVVAVEAIEGTDKMILRAGKLGGKGMTIVKVSQPNKDRRFDVPVVGSDTIATMIQAQALVLAFMAEKTLIFDREEMIKKADQGGITIYSF
jgi:DUF1009 family protein